MSAISIEDRRALVLNKGWTPLRTIPLIDALRKVLSKRARIVNPEDYQTLEWEDWAKLEPIGEQIIQGSRCAFRVPEVIVLTDYNKLPIPRRAFTRKMLYKRDDYQCQYCGERPGTENLSIDHVIPKSRGGDTSWANCVLACLSCNSKKANRLLKDTNLQLIRDPKAPPFELFKKEDFVKIDCWSKFVSEMYWSIELKN